MGFRFVCINENFNEVIGVEGLNGNHKTSTDTRPGGRVVQSEETPRTPFSSVDGFK